MFVRIPIVVIGLLLTLCLPGYSQHIRFEPYSFRTRDSSRTVTAELGYLKVPENRKKKNSRQIELAVIRLKSRAAHRQSPIVWLAGGPGDYGSDDIQGPFLRQMEALQELGDVIVLDQRGTGLSKPALKCPEPLNIDPTLPGTFEILLDEWKKHARGCRDHWETQGVDLAAYNTRESAADVNDLRKALGVRKIRLIGGSYGTHLGLAIIRYYPKHVERAVLVGVEGPDQTYKLPENFDQHLRKLENELLRQKEETHAQKLAQTLKELFEEVDRAPVTIEIKQDNGGTKITLTGFELRLLVRRALSSREGMVQLSTLGEAAKKGRWSFLGPIILRNRHRNVSAMAFMMDCASGASSERLKTISQQWRTSLLGRAVEFPFPWVCESWGDPNLGDSYRAPIKSEVPVLAISGTLDANTPPEQVDETLQDFTHRQRIVIDRGAHQGLSLAPAGVLDEIVRFMKAGAIRTKHFALPPLASSSGE